MPEPGRARLRRGLPCVTPQPANGPVPRRRLLIFAKLPEPGRVKTRLIPRLGSEGAALLYQAFLDDAIALCRGVEEADLEVWAPPGVSEPGEERGAVARFQRRYPGLGLRFQVGADLGARLGRAFEVAFEEGTDQVVIMGSDHPTLPLGYLRRAFSALSGAELVIGPSDDGGYYLVGLQRHAWPKAAGLFAGVPWSTPGVLAATRERSRDLKIGRVELPGWYDVDDPSDLPRLGRDAHAGSHTARMLARLAGDAAGREPPGIGTDSK